MKKTVSILLILLIALSLCGCGILRSEPQPPPNKDTDSENEPVADPGSSLFMGLPDGTESTGSVPEEKNGDEEEHYWDGDGSTYTPTLPEMLSYSTFSADGKDSEEKSVYAFYPIFGRLFLETGNYYQDSLISYWAGEFIPDDPEAFSSPGETLLRGTLLRFSGFSMAGDYWDEGVPCLLSLTGNELRIMISGEPPIRLAKDQTYSSLHPNCSLYFQQLAVLEEIPPGMAAEWICEEVSSDRGTMDLYLKLSSNHDLLFAVLPEDVSSPASVLFGSFGISTSDSGTIQVIAEQMGYGEMPFDGELAFRMDGDDLVLDVGDIISPLCPGVSGELIFTE